jgi:hypothetical protein
MENEESLRLIRLHPLAKFAPHRVDVFIVATFNGFGHCRWRQETERDRLSRSLLLSRRIIPGDTSICNGSLEDRSLNLHLI